VVISGALFFAVHESAHAVRGRRRGRQARLTAFAQALQQAGWTLGQNLRLDYRWGDGKPDTMRKHAANLAELAPDVILANSSAAVSPLLQVNRTVPIVFAAVADPVGAGYVESLAQPGGNARSRNSVPISWGDGPIIPGQERRLEPPAGLGARETKLWRGIVDRLPPTYFGLSIGHCWRPFVGTARSPTTSRRGLRSYGRHRWMPRHSSNLSS